MGDAPDTARLCWASSKSFNYPNIDNLKQQKCIILQCLWARNSDSSVEWFWLRVSQKATVETQQWPLPFEGSSGEVGPASKMFIHMAVRRRPQFLDTRAFPQGCLSIMTWQLALLRMSDPTKSKVEVTTSFMACSQKFQSVI